MDNRITTYMKKTLLAILSAAVLCACAGNNQVTLLPESAFEREIDGRQTSLYTIRGGNITAQLTNFGARLVSIWAPDRRGRLADVCPGYADIDSYLDNPGERFLGPIVGPVANRICKGTFTVDGETYHTPLNNDGNTLHGGFKGIDLMVWDVVALSDSSVTMSVLHPDGQEGWPGNLRIEVTFTLTGKDELRLDYKAVTDKATPVNLSCHCFFNLTGDCSRSILDHKLFIRSSRTTPVDSLLIPTGEHPLVDGTPMEFRDIKTIGLEVDADYDQLHNGHGYDHNWTIDRRTKDEIEYVCKLYEPESGRVLKVYSDQPGLQFYCGNFFDGAGIDKYGKPIGYRCALALETQKWPDAVNHPNFPNTILRPGETYTQTCIYKFSVK